MSIKIFYSIVFVCCWTVMVSCGGKQPETSEAASDSVSSIVTLTDAQLKNAGIATGKLELKSISSILRVNGKIDVPPQNMVSVSVALGGYLRSTSLLPGMHVNKGQVIAVMDDQQYIQLQQDYLTAKARLPFLENEYIRQRDLNASKASSDKVFQLAEAEFRSQQVQLAALAEKLKLIGVDPEKLSAGNISRSINVYSPINGFVSKVDVNIGKYVAPTEVLFELVNPDDIHLALKVFEKDLDKLYIGQRLVAFTNNQPGKKYPCEVLLIGKDISPEGNTDVHCHFERYDKSLVPGTYMNAEIAVRNTKALALPADAIVSYGGKQYVFVSRGKQQFALTEITTGETEDGYTEIFLPPASQLEKADFATKGAYSILMQMKNKAE
jgi:cobalt-zinc-cadmium efflux system membrane fusion protein